jgi:hypothetical protein
MPSASDVESLLEPHYAAIFAVDYDSTTREHDSKYRLLRTMSRSDILTGLPRTDVMQPRAEVGYSNLEYGWIGRRDKMA